MDKDKLKASFAAVRTRALVLGGVLLVIWILALFDYLALGGRLGELGIRPRDTERAWAILTASFIHGDLYHAAANTVPFLVLGGFIIARGLIRFTAVSLIGALASGVGIFVFGRFGTVHFGLSGVIFSYLGFLLLTAVFERTALSIVLALVAAALYGSIVVGVLPFNDGSSWEGHLFGLLGGALAARLLRAPARRPPATPTRPDSA